MKLPTLSEYRKGLAAVGDALVTVISLGVLHGTAQAVVIAVVNVLAAVGVVALPNAGGANATPTKASP